MASSYRKRKRFPTSPPVSRRLFTPAKVRRRPCHFSRSISYFYGTEPPCVKSTGKTFHPCEQCVECVTDLRGTDDLPAERLALHLHKKRTRACGPGPRITEINSLSMCIFTEQNLNLPVVRTDGRTDGSGRPRLNVSWLKNSTLSVERRGTLIRARIPSKSVLSSRKVSALRLRRMIGVCCAGLSTSACEWLCKG